MVIGGGFGGLASAARLAKLGHKVTLVESSHTLGGASQRISQDGFTWDAGPTSTLLPAVVRDLFRKTGRPLERELNLIPSAPRQHRFPDGSSVSIPSGSRANQRAAINELSSGLGAEWVNYVAEYADQWELLRRDFLERPYAPALAPTELRHLLDNRESLTKRASKLTDARLRSIVEFPVWLEGHRPKRVPAWVGVDAYLAQRFGEWTVAGGLAVIAEALAQRLVTRGVTVLTATTARDLVVREGAVRAVLTDSGEISADLVVCAIDPARLPQLRRHLRRTKSTSPPDSCHLAIRGALPCQSETVIHGEHPLVVRPGELTDDTQTLTLLTRGRDGVQALARSGLDLSNRIITRIDRDAATQATHGSAYGVLWRGRGTISRRLGPTTPIAGVYAAGAHANPGAGVPMVGLSAALVAQAIGQSD